MTNIFINGLSAKVGGGKSILNNYLRLLYENKDSKNNYFVLTPHKKEYVKYTNEFITIVDINKFYNNIFMYPFVYGFILPNLLKKLRIDVVFNLADIPIRTKIAQVFLFDWSYAVYPESVVWKTMDFMSLVTRKIKLFYFKKNLKFNNTMIVQSNVAKYRLETLYGIKDIKIVPNAVSLENMGVEDCFDFELPKGKKLLYLTYYYSHKNLEIFIPLAKEIKKNRLDYKLIITIDKFQHKKAAQFLKRINQLKLEDIIINVGPVDMKFVPSLYRQCNGLLMPTLLESFSGTYVEAMFHKLPIFTSDLDFAKVVCEDAAFYFDPNSVKSILELLNFAFGKQKSIYEKTQKGEIVLNNLLTWDEAFKRYNEIIEEHIYSDNFIDYINGDKLRGDDFSVEQIKEWFENEKEGYAKLGTKNIEKNKYQYHELNKATTFDYLEGNNFNNVLGIGSASGEEFLPILDKIKNLVILEPSEKFSKINNILSVPVKYIKPDVSGTLPFQDCEFDLIVAFGVLHHIPNVTKVVSECYRVLKDNGQMVVREPIVSMGNWTKPRKGLTRNERGIPHKIFKNILQEANFFFINSLFCDFPVLTKISQKIGLSPFNNRLITRLDILLSKIFEWNISYYRKTTLKKLSPASLAFVLKKQIKAN